MDPERRKRLLVFATVICAVILVADRLVLTPGFAFWSDRQARISELKKDIADSASLLNRENELKARWARMKRLSLPKRVTDAESQVFQAVSRWASGSNLSVTSLKPRWTRTAPTAQTLEVQLEGVGNMETLAKFLYALETDPLPLRVEDLQISSQDNKGEKLSLSVRFTGLVLEEAQS